jgi:hypothetical protein
MDYGVGQPGVPSAQARSSTRPILLAVMMTIGI